MRKNIAPENSLIITGKNIWVVSVPLKGSGKVISDTDISKWQWLTMQEDIERILAEMVSTVKLNELIENCLYYIKISFESIAMILLSDISNGFTIKTKNGKKYSYSISNGKDYKGFKLLMDQLENKLIKLKQ